MNLDGDRGILRGLSIGYFYFQSDQSNILHALFIYFFKLRDETKFIVRSKISLVFSRDKE